MEKTDSLPVTRIRGGKRERVSDTLVAEVPLTIFFDGEELVTIMCTPEFLPELAVGFLYAEGFIERVEDLTGLECAVEKPSVSVTTAGAGGSPGASGVLLKRKLLITPGCVSAAASLVGGAARGLERVESSLSLGAEEVVQTVREVHKRSELYRVTGGVHNAALCMGGEVICFSEDIGRHNALDKVIGHTLINRIRRDDKLVVTSGRISTAVVSKIVRGGIPVLVSRSAPTSEAARLAEAFGITLIGFARGKRFNVYSNDWRIAG